MQGRNLKSLTSKIQTNKSFIMGNAMNAAAQPQQPKQPSPAQGQSGRRVMVGPGVYTTLSAKTQPVTRLGQVARALVDQTTITTVSIAATSGYVYALTESSCPIVQFQDVPPGMPPSSLSALQSAYSTFMSQYAILQGQASTWIVTQPGTGSFSIFSQLTSVPQTMSDLNDIVTSNFTTLSALTPGTPGYQSLLAKQEAIINGQTGAVNGLITAMQTLGTNLENGCTALVASTQSGVLSQMVAAYATDIQSLTSAINSANQQISADNSKIAGEGVGAAVSLAVGVVGLLNFWNPIGWVMMAGGAVGAYYSITEIEVLKAQIAELKGQINTDTNYQQEDQKAASVMSAFCTQLQGFTTMNQATQAELTALENLYGTIATDITLAIADLNANDLASAQAEWNTIIAESQFLAQLTAYIWPTPAMLSAPSMFAAISGDIYSIATSGELYHYSGSSNAWTDMGVTALSVSGAGSVLIAIDGAPIAGGQIGGSNSSTLFVKSYSMPAQSWTTISSFPAANIATDGRSIYAVNQTVNDRQVYQYSGSGTTWTALAQLPGPDAAVQLAIAGGVVFALANNSQFVYQYNTSASSWSQVGTLTCASISGGGNFLAIIDTSNNQYVYNPATGGNPTWTGNNVLQVAQASNENQYAVNNVQALWLTEPSTSPISYTSLVSQNATGVFVSDTGLVYYADNEGNLYSITDTGTATVLPSYGS